MSFYSIGLVSDTSFVPDHISDRYGSVMAGTRLIRRGALRGGSASAYDIGTGRVEVGGVGSTLVDFVLTIAHIALIIVGISVLLQAI